MIQGYNTDINTQVKTLEDIIMSNEVLKKALMRKTLYQFRTGLINYNSTID